MNKIELTIKRKGKAEKQIIPDISKSGIIDLVAAAIEAKLDRDEFILCYAMSTAEVNINEKES